MFLPSQTKENDSTDMIMQTKCAVYLSLLLEKYSQTNSISAILTSPKKNFVAKWILRTTQVEYPNVNKLYNIS